MEISVAITLRVTRRRSWLTQADLATLLAVDRTFISKLERKKRYLSGTQVALLCLIYDHQLPVIYEKSRTRLCEVLLQRIAKLPVRPRHTQRQATIADLHARLTTSPLFYEHTT